MSLKQLDAAAVEAVTKQLHESALKLEMTISGDLRLNEKDVARLLGYAPGYLKHMRQEGRAPKHYTRGVGGGRISYRLFDMAEWIEERREDW